MRVAVPMGKGVRAGVILSFEDADSLLKTGAKAAEDNPTPEGGEPEDIRREGVAGGGGSAPEAAVTAAASLSGGGAAAPAFALKALLWPLEREPLLSSAYMDMAVQLGRRLTATPGRILSNLLPAGLRTSKARIRFFGSGKPRELTVKALAGLNEEELIGLGALWVEGKAEACLAGQNPLDAEVCVVTGDPPWPVRPAAKAQIALLEYLFEQGTPTRRQVLGALGSNASATMSLLVERGLVDIRPAAFHESALSRQDVEPGLPAHARVHDADAAEMPGEGAFVEPEGADLLGSEVADSFAPHSADSLSMEFVLPGSELCLTPHQRSVYDPLRRAAFSGEASTHLLFGITGSGKTAIYLELAREMLASGRSVMLLAPEVALALKLWNDVGVTLPGARRVLFHGYLGPLAKERIFRSLAGQKSPVIVVGTRSALFLPLEDIGLVVLDEEHDSSFKQDEGFTYQAKDVAWYRAGQNKALLLLGSATPDIKSFHAALEGKLPLHRLTERAGGASLQEVRLVRLPKARADAEPLAAESLAALTETVERGEQAVILLNRRGYAPQMYCLSCSATVKCPHCDIGLAYHKGRERLLCHYCGYSSPFPSPCSACKGMHFLPLGEGTEKLEERLFSLLPSGTGILRLDRDNTRRPGRMEAILGAFARKEASVLVGTQMLSKGHHFPDVTLAVVVDADLGLNLPDYRAAERTFQLLLQSSGRSGRGERPGSVFIQTRDPSHYCWEFVKNADYEGFFTREIALREKRKYPPFVFLALLRISFPMDAPEGLEQVNALGAALRARAREAGVTLLGPAPAPLPFLKGRRRFHCLLKGAAWSALREVYGAALETSARTRLRVTLDLDPVNML